MKKSEKKFLSSKTHPQKILKRRRVRFDLPVKEKEIHCPSGVSLSQDDLEESNSHLPKVEPTFPSPVSVEVPLPVADMTGERQESMGSSTRLQKDRECNLVRHDMPAKEIDTIWSKYSPVTADKIEEPKRCTMKLRSLRSLLSVEEEIVQILAEMQMKRADSAVGMNFEETQGKSPDHEQTENIGCVPVVTAVTTCTSEGNQEATITPNHLGDDGTAPVAVGVTNAILGSNVEETIIRNPTEDNDNGPVVADVTSGDVEGNLREPVIPNQPIDYDSGCSVNVDAADCDTKENIEAIVGTDKVKDDTLGASQIRVQLALKLVMKEEGPSLVVVSPHVLEEANRGVLNVKQGISSQLQDVQILETKMPAEGNSQVSVCISLQHGKCAVKKEKENGFNGDSGEMCLSNTTFAAIRDSNIEEDSDDDVQVIYESKNYGSISHSLKHEKGEVQQEEAYHFDADRKDLEAVSMVKCDKHIKEEEEGSSMMDKVVSASSFPHNNHAAGDNNIEVDEKSDLSEDEYDCPLCAWLESQTHAVNQEKTDCLNVVARTLGLTSPLLDCGISDAQVKKEDSIDIEEHDLNTDCTTDVSFIKGNIEANAEETPLSGQAEDGGLLNGWLGWERQETVGNLDEYTDDWETDCPPEIHTLNTITERDPQKTVISDEDIENDCVPEICTVNTNTEGALQETVLSDEDTETDCLQEISITNTNTEGDLQGTVISEEAIESDCAPEVCTVNTNTEEALQETVIADEDIETDCLQEISVTNTVTEGDLQGTVILEEAIECGHQSRILKSPQTSKEDSSLESGLQKGTQKSTITINEDSTVKSGLPSQVSKIPKVSTGYQSILSNSAPKSWNPNRILVVKLRKIDVRDYYKGIESPVRNKKSIYMRTRDTDQVQADNDIMVSPDCYRHHIPGDGSQDHINTSSESLESTIGNSSQGGVNISLTDHEIITDDACSYNCNSCSEVFLSKYSLIKHVFTHIDVHAPDHICKFCATVFNSAFELQRHYKEMLCCMLHKEKTHITYQAHESNSQNSVHSSSVKNENMQREFTCSSCTEVFTSKYSLISHVFNHIDGVQAPSHICKVCGRVLSTSFCLRRHYKYGCKGSYCKMTQSTASQLQESIHHHINTSLNKNEVVGQETTQFRHAISTNKQDSARKEVHDHVDDEQMYSHICSVCGGIFSTALRLEKHFLKICSRIENSIQCINGMQKSTQQEIINDCSSRSERIGEVTTNFEFKCSSCPEVFSSKDCLTNHEFTHVDSIHAPKFNCQVCGKIFNTEFHLEMHMARKEQCTVAEEKDDVIDLFNKVRVLPRVNNLSQQQSNISVSSAQSLNYIIKNIRVTYKLSMKTGHKERLYLCDFCEKPFRRKGNLVAHRCTHTGERNCICSICGKAFGVMGNLKRHLLTHSGEYPYCCNFCSRQFKQKEHLKRHVRIHTGEQPHKCNICGKRFKQSSTLQKHKMVHTGEKPYQCEVCGRTFSLLGNLKQHAFTHANEKGYTCEICFKSFNRDTSLKRHTCLSPDENRKFKCNVCYRYFTKYDFLQRHTATHLDVRAHKCDVCGKSFVSATQLKIHHYIHTGEKRYKCEICGKAFIQSGSMKRHLRVHVKGH